MKAHSLTSVNRPSRLFPIHFSFSYSNGSFAVRISLQCPKINEAQKASSNVYHFSGRKCLVMMRKITENPKQRMNGRWIALECCQIRTEKGRFLRRVGCSFQLLAPLPTSIS